MDVRFDMGILEGVFPALRLEWGERVGGTDVDALAGNDLADLSDAWRGDEIGGGEEEFVVFAIVEGVVEGGEAVAAGEFDRVFVDGDGGGIEMRGDVALMADVGEIAGEAIGEIEHGGDAVVGGEIAGEMDAGGEGHVSAEDRAAEGAGDVEVIAWFGAGAGDGGEAGGAGENGDREGELVGPGGGVAADDLAVEFISGGLDA